MANSNLCTATTMNQTIRQDQNTWKSQKYGGIPWKNKSMTPI